MDLTASLIASSIPQFHDLTLAEMSQMRPCSGFLLELPEDRYPLHLHYPFMAHSIRPWKAWTVPNDEGIIFSVIQGRLHR